MGLKKLGVLASGQKLFDREDSHMHEGVSELLPEALSKVHLSSEPFVVQQVEFDRVIGKTSGVATTDADDIIYAKRPGRKGLTRFVKNRQPEPTSSMVLIFKRMSKGDYLLITAWIGGKAEPEPWDRNATEASVDFWNSHALVWGTEKIIEGTETTTCPW